MGWVGPYYSKGPTILRGGNRQFEVSNFTYGLASVGMTASLIGGSGHGADGAPPPD